MVLRRRSEQRSARFGAVIGAAAAAFVSTSVALAAFNSTVTGGGVAYSTKRIFPAVRSTSGWTIRDASGGGAEVNNDDTLSYSDGRTTTTGSWSSAFSTTRYIQADFNAGRASGIAISSAQLNFRVASTNNSATECFYLEVYRASSSTLIGTHGSSGSPQACVSGTTQTTITPVSLPEITDTTIANDLRIRIYGNDSKNRASAVDMVTVTASTAYASFTAYETTFTDQASGTATIAGWGPATSADSFNYQTAAAWAATFSTARYVKLTFDPGVPAGAVITAATVDFYYRSASGTDTVCWYMESYNGATLLAAHGSSTSTISCRAATTAYSTDNVSLPELSAVADANNLTIKVYMNSAAAQKAQFDLVRLNLSYYLD